MADENQDRGPGIAGNGFIWLLLVAAGTAFIHYQSPLEDFRPVTMAPTPSHYHALQDVDARLWQDPFTAIAKDEEQTVSRDAAARAELKAARQHRDTKGIRDDIGREKKVTIIGVTVPGAPYSEETEARRRSRFAVAAALGAARYRPYDEQHIGYFVRAGGTDQENETVPFEKFTAEDEAVFVLWLNEGALNASGRPLHALAELLCDLMPKGSPKIKIIGPGDGDTVRSMLQETQEPASPDFCGHAPEFYAYGVTVDDSIFLQDVIKDKTDVPKTLTNYFRNLPPQPNHDSAQKSPSYKYYRTIASDDRLAAVLVAELQRRGVESLDQIAVVSEWDTLYGRAFPNTIAYHFDDKSPLYQRFSYLRGLDGQLPNAEFSSNAKVSKARGSNLENGEKDGTSGAGGTKPSERADGESQFDYLRRLADRMKQQDAELRLNGGKGIKAIGVLGSDVYDKLLALRALRPEFPEALFFTTDLDARLLDPSEHQWTHNLLVASGFDLRLRDGVQRDIPPFRDSYETAVFLSTWLALQDNGDFDKKNVPDKWLKPLLFEIGRTRAFSLATEDPKEPAGGSAHQPPHDESKPGTTSLYDYDSIHPIGAPAALSGGSLASVVALMTLVLCGFAMSFQRVRYGKAADGPQTIRPVRAIVIAVSALLVSLVIFIPWPAIVSTLTTRGLGEPMALFEGISLWPTILLRSLAALLGIRLIIHTFHRLNTNIDSVVQTLQMGFTRDRTWKPSEIFYFRRAPKLPAVPSQGDINKFWQYYVNQGRTALRIRRVVLCVAAMFGVMFIIAGIFGFPAVPARGSLSWWSYQIATLAEVLTTWFVIFLVAEATVVSCLFLRELLRFLRELPPPSSVWPSSTIKHFNSDLGLDSPYIDAWISIRLVALRTKCIIKLIYWPFLLVALLIISRSSLFAAFSIGPTLAIAQGIAITILIGCVLWLRWAAERARDAACERMADHLVAAHGSDSPTDVKRAIQIEILLSRVRKIQEGAFSPIAQQPLVRALLLPLGSYGGIALLQNFAVPGLQ